MTSLLVMLCAQAAFAQQVSFFINDGLDNIALRDKLESNLSLLLSEFNRAYDTNGGKPDMSLVSISPEAAGAIQMLWRNTPFHCDETQIVERLLQTADHGYQVRNVPVELKEPSGNTAYQELVIDMDRSGCITRINLAIGAHLWRRVMSEGTDVSDLRHRQVILDYVEQFRTAYNLKDIDFLEMIFSDDALIITGKVIKRKKGDKVTFNDDQIVYTKYSKREYIDRLRKTVFPNTSYIKVDFSDVTVVKHPTIDGYYGVTVRQKYESSIYADDGYLFMLWDFRNENRPQIHVRTWQPYWMDEARTKTIREDQIIGINNFKNLGK